MYGLKATLASFKRYHMALATGYCRKTSTGLLLILFPREGDCKRESEKELLGACPIKVILIKKFLFIKFKPRIFSEVEALNHALTGK